MPSHDNFSSENLRHRRVLATLESYVAETKDHDLYGGERPYNRRVNRALLLDAVVDWAEKCTLKPSDMPKWWRAGCFEPEAAQLFIEAGIGVGLAKRSCGEKGEEIDTFAYHVSIGAMSISDAKAQLLG